ncbi:hypothetical protein ACB098_10G102300 [Castanea mollissima]
MENLTEEIWKVVHLCLMWSSWRQRNLHTLRENLSVVQLKLLETVIKNCGDIVHMHVAEKDVLHEMVKIVKKKPDFHVKEKILILIDTWQEAFGGPRARYPQYYAAYQDLLRAGAVFPQRSERAAPVFTPPQTQPLSSYPQNLRNPDNQLETAESSADSEFPTLSLTEIQNARGIMDVLAEMLSAIEPANKEGLRQEVVVDLVEQCRTYKQRVVHLVNSTSDESLLCQGLSLNDDLQRVLARHEAIASGTSVQTEKTKPEPVRSLIDVGGPLVDAGENTKQPDGRSTSSASAGAQPLNQLLLPAPPVTNAAAPSARVDPKMDLLSGDDYSSPKADNSLALVPVGVQPPNTPLSQQNALVLFDMFTDANTSNSVNTQSANLAGQSNHLAHPIQQQPNTQSPQGGFYSNGSAPNVGSPQYEQSVYMQGAGSAWNGQIPQQQQPPSSVYGAQSSGSFPPPPWEAQPVDNGSLVAAAQYPQPVQAGQVVVTHPLGSQPMRNDQVVGMYIQPITGGHLSAINGQVGQSQQLGLHSQPIQGGPYMGMVPQPMQATQMMPMYPQQMYGNQYAGYGYGQQQGMQYVEQGMYGLSVSDNNGSRNSYQVPTSSYVTPNKPSKPEDKLFGDLVNMAKVKPTKPTPGSAGSM